MLDKRIINLPSEIWTKIARVDELKGSFSAGAKLGPQVLGRLKKSVLITSSGSSPRIEGAKLSDEDIEKLMRGISVQKFTDRDEQEVRGYYELLENVFNSWQTIIFSESVMKHFHKELLKYVEKDKLHRGEYKKSENKVIMINEAGQSAGILFDTVSPYLTPSRMQELVEWTRNALIAKKYHPLLIIGNFLVEFLAVHPFTDGNGRLSRILTNLLLLKSGYIYMPYISHEKLVEDNKPDYYLALRTSQKTFGTKNDNVESWLNFFLDMLFKQAEMAVELLGAENLENILSPKQLKIWQYLLTVEETTPRKIESVTKISRPTVNQVLSKLLNLKKIERLGFGRATRYRKI
ncbi:MAG: Fic family protein [Patescibacteria group bacterium]